MTKIIGVRFENAGKIYYFDPGEWKLDRGSRVIVETARGTECGRVVLSPREVEESEIVQPLRQVIREANEEDMAKVEENHAKEKDAFRICRELIRKHHLDMKLVKAEYTFDNKKILFYFTADGRIDFRDLVRDLASVFKTRIELRQIGVRDETKLLGGIGICGRPLCCSTYLTDFIPVSIKMAKEQNLSLNPAKISGVCGRLMCCLKNEEEAYEYLNKNLPGVGDIMETPDGKEGVVQTVNVLKQTVRILIENGDNKEIEEHPADELVLLAKRKKGGVYQQIVKREDRPGTPEDAETVQKRERPARGDARGDRKRENGKPAGREEERDRRRERSRNGGPQKPEARGGRDRNYRPGGRKKPADPDNGTEINELKKAEGQPEPAEKDGQNEAGPSAERRHHRRRRRRPVSREGGAPSGDDRGNESQTE